MAKNKSSTLKGILIGIPLGLAIAAISALIISNAPVPFMDKVEKVTADVDPSEVLAGAVDPNLRLNQNAPDEISTKVSSVNRVDLTRSTPNVGSYWIQAGAYQSHERAKSIQGTLVLDLGVAVDLQNVNNLWRVRIGPFESRDRAQEIQERLATSESSKELQTSIIRQ